MFEALINREKKVAVIGLGYVGLPLALAMAKHFSVIGFDHNPERIEMLGNGLDPSQELVTDDFNGCDIEFTSNSDSLRNAHFFIIAVPTDVDDYKVPDLSHLKNASERVGAALKPGDYVVFESTVFPGCTEEDCVPVLEKSSGLKAGIDFKFGYSPERINPGDKSRPITQILKVVSGCDDASLAEIAQVYGKVIEAGIYQAPSIKVAEAAKVIENTQRDLNISLMNELAIIFDRLGIDTHQVIQTAATKWNFTPYYPGLVGGHCIGVDPYYLLFKSIETGYEPQVILSGRRVNDGMPAWIAKRLVQMLIQRDKNPGLAKVLVLGITFKENVADIRNSKVAALVQELQGYRINVHVYDPNASPNDVARAYGLTLIDQISVGYDAIIVAVGHKQFLAFKNDFFLKISNEKPILMDLKGIYKEVDEQITYWRL
ncbi:MAG: nucleotide sugar dehydrogenase [Saprospiraceae bacterium]|nr:nucleotide sugar dehydrogenase [Saprospiraceae bacterium]